MIEEHGESIVRACRLGIAADVGHELLCVQEIAQ